MPSNTFSPDKPHHCLAVPSSVCPKCRPVDSVSIKRRKAPLARALPISSKNVSDPHRWHSHNRDNQNRITVNVPSQSYLGGDTRGCSAATRSSERGTLPWASI